MNRATALFAIPSFLRGMASVLDVGNTLTIYNESENAGEADYKAICADWQAIGDDLSFSLAKWEKNIGEQENK